MDRKLRRSHFLLNESFFSVITPILANANPGAKKEIFNAARIATVGGGLMALTGAAYAMFKTGGSPIPSVPDDGTDELPGVVSEATKDPDVLPDEKVLSDIEKADKNSDQPFSKTKKPSPDDTGFWQRLKEMFGFEKPTQPSSSVAKGASISGPASAIITRSLPNSFRSKVAFTGIVGADMLSSMGSYTQEEANEIIRLKTSNKNTGASGGMSKDIENLIRATAKKYGVSEDQALKVAMMESGGNPNAISATGALGIYQFTGRTATDEGLQNRFDPVQTIEAGVKMLAKNAQRLDKEGILPTPINLYLVHQLGYAGARELLIAAEKDLPIASLSPSLQDAIRLNYGGKSAKTARGYVDSTNLALESKAKGLTRVASSSTSPPVTSPTKGVPVSVEKMSQATAAPILVASIPPETIAKIPTVKSSPIVSSNSPPRAEQKSGFNVPSSPQGAIKLNNGTVVALEG